MATGPQTFFPLFRDYLVAKLQTTPARVQIDVGPPKEGKASDGKTVTMWLSTPTPYGSPDQGAGRSTYQVTRRLSVLLTTANTGDHGSNRERLLHQHWAFEDKILNAIQQCNFKVLGWNRSPALVSGSEEYKHGRDVAGGLESTLIFEITYTANVLADQPGPPV